MPISARGFYLGDEFIEVVPAEGPTYEFNGLIRKAEEGALTEDDINRAAVLIQSADFHPNVRYSRFSDQTFLNRLAGIENTSQSQEYMVQCLKLVEILFRCPATDLGQTAHTTLSLQYAASTNSPFFMKAVIEHARDKITPEMYKDSVEAALSAYNIASLEILLELHQQDTSRYPLPPLVDNLARKADPVVSDREPRRPARDAILYQLATRGVDLAALRDEAVEKRAMCPRYSHEIGQYSNVIASIDSVMTKRGEIRAMTLGGGASAAGGGGGAAAAAAAEDEDPKRGPAP